MHVLADLAPHHLDPAFNALELDSPETVEATGPGVDEEVCTTLRQGMMLRRPKAA